MEFYLLDGGRRVGPIDEKTVRAAVMEGEYSPDQLAWVEGKAAWHPLRDLIDFAPAPTSLVAGDGLPELPCDEATENEAVVDADDADDDRSVDPPEPEATLQGKLMILVVFINGALSQYFAGEDGWEQAGFLITVALHIGAIIFVVEKKNRPVSVFLVLNGVVSACLTFLNHEAARGMGLVAHALSQLLLSLPFAYTFLAVALMVHAFAYRARETAKQRRG